MPPYLDPVSFGTDVVGIMDHPMRQPQKPLFNGFQVVGHGFRLSYSAFVGNSINHEGISCDLRDIQAFMSGTL